MLLALALMALAPLLLGLEQLGDADHVVQARQFQVVSPSGEVQARLGYAGEFGGLLSLSNARGEPRVILTLTTQGDPIMEMMASNGEAVLRAFVRDNGGRLLLLSGGKPLLSLHTNVVGGGLATLRPNGKVLVDVSALQDGAGALIVRSADGVPVARLSSEDGKGALLLYNGDTSEELNLYPDSPLDP